MGALLTKIVGDLRRRRLQAFLVALIVALATGVGTLSLELMSESSSPYTHAFEQYQGAHLTVFFDGALVSPEQLQPTTHLPEVTASAGPWPLIYIPLEYGTQKVFVHIIARADPGGSVGRLHLTAGRWATHSGEIVLTRSFAQSIGAQIGSTVKVLRGSDLPQLVVVGEVVDIDEGSAATFTPQNSWVQPEEFSALLPQGQQPGQVMLYRFRHAATTVEVQQRLQEIIAAVPPHAVTSSISHLTVAQIFTLTANLTLTLLLAFSVFALGAAAAIIANVVSGAVVTSHREIGIIKALGFTPGQVVATFVGQMLAAGLIGCVVGIPLGIVTSRPLVSSSAEAIGLPAPSGLTLAAPLVASLGGLLVVAVAAALPALRAGLLRPVDALTSNAPRPMRRSWIGSLSQRVGLPRPISLGTGDAFARPMRGLLTTLAVVFGVTTLVFAFGLNATFQKVVSNRGLTTSADVTVMRFASYPDSALVATLNAQPETRRVLAYSFFGLSTSGLSSPITTTAFRGDSASLDYPLLAGRWFRGPDEIVGGPAFLKEAHLAVGDSFIATINGKQLPLRLVGEYFNFDNSGRVAAIDWATYLEADPTVQPDMYLVDLQSHAHAEAYAQRVAASAPDFLSISTGPNNGVVSSIATLDIVLAALAAILAALAVAGVFNALLLNFYERVRDTATLKALGMTPGQVVSMVAASACVLGVIGGLIGVPLGVWLHQLLIANSNSVVGEQLPESFRQGVFSPLALLMLALAGVAVALIGAALPAWIAVRAPVVAVLRTE